MNCIAPLSLERLVEYQLGELSEADALAIEEHYFACQHCAERLQALALLGAGVEQAVRLGLVSLSVPADLLQRAREQGLEIRSYRALAGRSLQCTAAPTDDFVAIQLGLELARTESVDVAVEWTSLDSGVTEQRLIEDVVYDHATQQVVLLFAGAQVREFPKSQWRMQAVVHEGVHERRVGPYVLNHTPWERLQEG